MPGLQHKIVSRSDIWYSKDPSTISYKAEYKVETVYPGRALYPNTCVSTCVLRKMMCHVTLAPSEKRTREPCLGTNCEYGLSVNPQLKGILAESCYLMVLCTPITEF